MKTFLNNLKDRIKVCIMKSCLTEILEIEKFLEFYNKKQFKYIESIHSNVNDDEALDVLIYAQEKNSCEMKSYEKRLNYLKRRYQKLAS